MRVAASWTLTAPTSTPVVLILLGAAITYTARAVAAATAPWRLTPDGIRRRRWILVGLFELAVACYVLAVVAYLTGVS